MRRGIRSVRLAVAGQATLYLALAVLVWYLTSREDAPSSFALPLALVTVNSAVVLALVVCSVLLFRRQRAILLAVIGLECGFMAMLFVGAIITLAQSSGSGTSAPFGIIVWGLLMQVVLRPLQKPEFRAAFGLKPIKPRQKKK